MGPTEPTSQMNDRIAELERSLQQLKDEAARQSVQPLEQPTRPPQGAQAGVPQGVSGKATESFPEGFALFTGRHRRAGGAVPRAAFQRRGNLSLNRAAFEALGSPDAVVLGYNQTVGEVAIKGSAASVAYASPVRKQAAADSYLVATRAFTQSIGLDVEQSVLVFDQVRVDRDGILVLKLEDGRRLFTRNRRTPPRSESEELP